MGRNNSITCPRVFFFFGITFIIFLIFLVVAMTERFNLTSDWILNSLCTATTLKARAHLLNKVIKIAKELADLGNFNGVLEIMSALRRTPVTRLTQTFDVSYFFYDIFFFFSFFLYCLYIRSSFLCYCVFHSHILFFFFYSFFLFFFISFFFRILNI